MLKLFLTFLMTIKVCFSEPIKFEECPEIQNLVVGQEGHIRCRAVDNPKPTISWKKDGSLINSDRITINELGLTIPYVKREDEGNYLLVAFVKETGSILVQKIDVNVVTRPSALYQIVFDKVTSTSLTLRLIDPLNTGGMPITHYIMKYKLADQKDDPLKEVTWVKDTSHTLCNLIPRAKYHFQVAAINVVGVGDYKTELYVMPDEYVPQPPLIKTKQETISDYPDRFEVWWDVPNSNGKTILKYEISYFKVERGRNGWTETEKAVKRTANADSQGYMLTGLMPDSYYKIEIRASNEIGNSLPESVIIKTSKGIESSYTCKRCDEPDIKRFPTTRWQLSAICGRHITFLECELHYKENCGNPSSPFDSSSLEAVYGALATAKEVCSIYTLLNAVVVDNLLCYKKIMEEADSVCISGEPDLERLRRYAKALFKNGLLSFTNYENNTHRLYHCMGIINSLACQIIEIERECGYVAKRAAVEIFNGAGPGPGVYLGCEEFYEVLPDVVFLRITEEENLNFK